MHDPEEYEDPDEFRPERFIRDGKLDPNVRDPLAFVFGFGRRLAFADIKGLRMLRSCVVHIGFALADISL